MGQLTQQQLDNVDRRVGKLESLQSGIRTGAVFPAAPVVNQHFIRTDREIEYYFDGTRWLSVNPSIVALVPRNFNNPAAQPAAVGGFWDLSFPMRDDYDIWVEIIMVYGNHGATQDASNYYTVSASGSGFTSSVTSISLGGTGQKKYNMAITPGVYAKTNFIIDVSMTRSAGSPGVTEWMGWVQYRLIG